MLVDWALVGGTGVGLAMDTPDCDPGGLEFMLGKGENDIACCMG